MNPLRGAACLEWHGDVACMHVRVRGVRIAVFDGRSHSPPYEGYGVHVQGLVGLRGFRTREDAVFAVPDVLRGVARHLCDVAAFIERSEEESPRGGEGKGA